MYKIVKAVAAGAFENKLNEAINDGYGVKHFSAVEAQGTIWLIALVYRPEY